MDYTNRIVNIKEWFNVIREVAFELPDGIIGGRLGEYGGSLDSVKMYEDYIEMTFVAAPMLMKIWGDFAINIYLHEFTYEGVKMGKIDEGYLEISRFDKLYVEYGCGRTFKETYDEGSVSFYVLPPEPIDEKIRHYMQKLDKR